MAEIGGSVRDRTQQSSFAAAVMQSGNVAPVKRPSKQHTPKTLKTTIGNNKADPAPNKKELWWIDDKMARERKKYDKKFDSNSVGDAYSKKMAKLKKQREKELLGKAFRQWRENTTKMQSGLDSFMNVSNRIGDPEVASMAEDVILLVYEMTRARCVMDYVVSALSFMKRRCSLETIQRIRASLIDFVKGVISDDDTMTMQSGVEGKLKTARDVLRYWPRLKASPLWRKVNTVVIYVTSLALFKDGVTKPKVVKIEDNFYTKRAHIQADFTYNVLDLLLFVAERGLQVIKSKKLDPMFHSSGAYEEWYDEAADIIAKSKFLSNPAAHDIDIHNFAAKITELHTKGQSMYRYACELDKSCRRTIQATCNQLLAVRATYFNKKTGQQTRRAPLAIVLEGHSSVGKTTFATALHYYYGITRGKNVDAGARYTRMSTAEFWDSFTSDQWSLLIDDAASIKPGVSKDIDPSIRELLLVVNNAPFSPNMASIEEKGNAPFLCELVVVTTNTPDLNLEHYFNTPGAVARRLPFHVRIRPKAEYKKNDTMLDETRLPEIIPGVFPDWWDIEVLEPRMVSMSGDAALEFKQTFELHQIHAKMSMAEFLPWYHGVITKHNLIQDKVALSEESFRATKICTTCHVPTGMCKCIIDVASEGIITSEMQSGLVSDTVDMVSNIYGNCTSDDRERPRDMSPDEYVYIISWLPSMLIGLFVLFLNPLTWLKNMAFASFNYVLAYRRHIIRSILSGDTIAHVVSELTNRTFWAFRQCLEEQFDLAVAHASRAVTNAWAYSLVLKARLGALGERVANYYFSLPHLCRLIVIVLAACIGLFALGAFIQNGDPEPTMQGNLLSKTGVKPLSKGETENVWKKEVYTPSLMDLGRSTISWKGMDDSDVRRILARNCAFVKFKNGDNWKVAKCFGIGGQYFITTNHSLPDFGEKIECMLVRSSIADGPSSTVRFLLSKNDTIRDHDKDILVFQCLSVPPLRNVMDLFVREKLGDFRANGFLYGRDIDGNMKCIETLGIQQRQKWNPELNCDTTIWWSKGSGPTVNGDCGMILVGRSGSGPVILGLHQLGANTLLGAINVTYEQLVSMLDGRLVVGGVPPLLDAPSTNVGLPGPLHDKSPLRYMDEGTLECYGSFEGFRQQPKFRTRESILVPSLLEKGWEVKHSAPQAKGWKPKRDALMDLALVHPNVCADTVEQCVDAFVGDMKKINPKWKSEIVVYDMHTAINGVPGLKYVDGIKRSTSAGFPYRKPKAFYTEPLEPTEDYPDHITITPEIENRVEQILENYSRNECGGAVFSATLKDEALPKEKVAKGKVRTFMMGSIEMTIIMRMFLLSFVRVAQSNHFVFECAPGLEAQSVEWDILFQYLTQFGNDRCVFGDFKGFDRSMHPIFMLAAFRTIAKFVYWCTGDIVHHNAILCISYDISFAYVDYFGDLLRLYGKNPSGQALTSVINGLVNSLYMRFVYLHCSPNRECVTFKKYVALVTYGDDNGMNVSTEISFFNHTTIVEILATIGVTYTMADKETDSVPFVTIHDGQFLCRSWRWCDETKTWVCPLKMESINKMLTMCTPSSVLSPEAQAADTIRSANSEFFWHGRESFEKHHVMLEELLDECNIRPLLRSPLETWYDLMERYKASSLRYLRETDTPAFAKTDHYQLGTMQAGLESDYLFRHCTFCNVLRYDDYDQDCMNCGRNDVCERCGQIGMTHQYSIYNVRGYNPQICVGCARSLSESLCCRVCLKRGCQRNYGIVNCVQCVGCSRCIEAGGECGYCDTSDIYEGYSEEHGGLGGQSRSAAANQTTHTILNPPSSQGSGDEVYAYSVDARSLVSSPTIGALRRRTRTTQFTPQAGGDTGNLQPTETNNTNFQLQSGVEEGSNSNTSVDVMANTVSTSQETMQTATFLDSGVGDTLTFAEPKPSSFVYDKQWNAELGDFLSRPRLINTVTWTPGVLSNSQFDPWSLYLSTPEIAYKLNNYAYFRGQLKVKVVVNAAPFYYGALMMYYTPLPGSTFPLSSVSGSSIQRSQRPHIWILPQNNEGGEMSLPFFYTKNFVNITSASEVATLGNLTLWPFTQLASANGATSNGVQMQFYAWIEHAELFGPTVSLSMQSGDEYGNGPVSAPAAAVAHWATYLSRVPIIGKFAKATGIGASAISQMAKLFGWSNVPVIEDVKPMKNLPFHDMASAHISEPTTKFLLDPKGELSVDPGLVGLSGEDELSISHLVQKESYLATGTWTAGGAAGAIIFSSAVSPALFERGTASSAGTYTVTMTPMAWVGSAFAHWRGDIIFRFKVVCSKFHSGRLRVHWDPLGLPSSTSDFTHVTYTTILDIQESDEVEFRVPYMQALPWLETETVVTPNLWSTTVSSSASAKRNGTLTVRVLNNLTAPVDTASCSVLIFVKGGENLEFANPKDISPYLNLFSMQSGTEPCVTNTPMDERYLVNWGEPVPSIRLLLRRSSLVDRITIPRNIPATDEAGTLRVYQSRLPPPPGYDPTAYTTAKGVETPATTYPFSFTYNTHMAWFSAAFIAMRGSTRWHYNVVNPDGAIPNNIQITRRVGNTFNSGSQGLECTYISGANATSTSQSLIKGRSWNAYGTQQGSSGLALTNPITQTGMGVEFPMMTNYLFQFANPQKWFLGNSSDGSTLDNYALDVNIHPAAGTGFNRLQVYRYAAAGTDFTLHWFLNTPVVSYNSNAGSVVV